MSDAKRSGAFLAALCVAIALLHTGRNFFAVMAVQAVLQFTLHIIGEWAEDGPKARQRQGGA